MNRFYNTDFRKINILKPHIITSGAEGGGALPNPIQPPSMDIIKILANFIEKPKTNYLGGFKFYKQIRNKYIIV